MTDKTVIRASSLPQYPDCTRRHAARSYPDIVAAAGYDLRQIPPSIGAAIGTGTHAGLAFAMTERMEGRDASAADVAAQITGSVDAEIADGVVWDDTTTNVAAAHKQAIRQAVAVLQTFGHQIHPVAVEEYMEADLGDGFMLSGHIDIREAARVADFKTGTVQRVNLAQYGGYSLLAKANGHTVTAVAEIYVKRAGPTRPQPDAILTEYPLDECELAAWATAQSIKATVTRFRETGDAWEFIANPNSMMCGADYCPAFGTNFCKSHKPENDK